MAHYDRNWDDLGRNIQDIIDRAVYSRDYDRLNQTIRQAVETAVGVGSEAVRKAVDGVNRPAAAAKGTTAAQVKKDLPVLYANPGRKNTGGILKTVFGSLSVFFGLLFLVASIFVDMVPGLFVLASLFLVLGLGGAAVGGGLLFSGTRTLGKIRRFKTYRKILGQKTHCTLEELARGVGKSVKFVRREVLRMINEGLFLQGHLDHEGPSLITSHETFQHYEQSRLALEQRQREEAEKPAPKEKPAGHSPQVQEVLDRGSAFVAEIRRCNDEIPGEEISEKIDRMELIVRRIFQRAEAHPEIVPDLKKLMDYYLPMTVKLLNAYADMDAQPIQGATIQASKREIEGTLDTLNLAFEKLLDDLFAETALDVSSDITVLQTLLSQEGLTEDELTKMKKQQKL